MDMWSKKFDVRTVEKLFGVHPVFSACIVDAIVKFGDANPGFRVSVTEGLRTSERQKELYRAGATWTLKSKHLQGTAVDIAVLTVPTIYDGIHPEKPRMVEGLEMYETFADLARAAGVRVGLPITWGGDWKQRDGCHLEVSS